MEIIKTKKFWITFVFSYGPAIGGLWIFFDVFTYFTGEKLKEILGGYWAIIFYGIPLIMAFTSAYFLGKKRQSDRVKLSYLSNDIAPYIIILNTLIQLSKNKHEQRVLLKSKDELMKSFHNKLQESGHVVIQESLT